MLMKMLLTAEMRPRIWSGTRVSMSVLRMTTLMLSSAPDKASIASDSGNHVEKPNTMVATPKPVTAQRKAGPARRKGG